MSWDRVEGKWKQLRGEVMERWGELTDYDDLDEVNGRGEQVLGKLEERLDSLERRRKRNSRSFPKPSRNPFDA